MLRHDYIKLLKELYKNILLNISKKTNASNSKIKIDR